ncbi:MAG: S8 family serine peptidase [Pseudomonadota bacterium]
MPSTSGLLRRLGLLLAVLLSGSLCADLNPAAAQFRPGFGRFGHPMMAGRFGPGPYWRGRLPPRYGWRGGGRYYPIYPGYPVYPVYPAYPAAPAYPVSHPHRVAQASPPPAPPIRHHAHANTGGGHRKIAAAPVRPIVPHEIITEFAPGASPQAIARLARHFDLTRVESRSFALIDSSLTRWHIGNDTPVEDTVNALRREKIVASVQPNYVFTLQEQSITPIVGDPAQYVLDKLEVPAAHRLATGKHILIAVIDSDIDVKHPDLAGAIVKSFDALGGDAHPHPHGTAMAGAIAAHGKLLGIAPAAELLSARAFDDATGAAHGTSFAIYKSLQWAADNGARVVNMSFAGPEDPTLHRLLEAAYEKNMVLVAAAGNAGPKSAPLYPAADPDVIAVTATDSDDGLYKMANRGSYIALAAPGVEVLVVAPGEAYQLTTGTSVAAAHVSGIAALLLERKASLTPADIRTILMATAKPLGAKNIGTKEQSAAFGAGLADAYHAAMAPDAAVKPAAVQAKR